jgi:2-polyprenyl-3-methyl-5-hydroxy-6-metoxy-1,4-benzoquinol methylase
LDNAKDAIREFYDLVSSNYGDRYDESQILKAERYSANYYRHQMLINILKEVNAKKVLEVGCGEGTPLIHLHGLGYELEGFDLSPNMVSIAKERAKLSDLDPSKVFLADIENIESLRSSKYFGEYDVVFAFGVLPHVNSVTLSLQNMKALLKPGGRLIFEYRNKLFSLFTLNKFTEDFFLNDLLFDQDKDVKLAVKNWLSKRLDLNRKSAEHLVKQGRTYESIRANFHNPLMWPDKVQDNGFKFIKHHWYHYHALPPSLENIVGTEFFRQKSMEMESLNNKESDWRGFFMCSAGVIEAQKL